MSDQRAQIPFGRHVAEAQDRALPPEVRLRARALLFGEAPRAHLLLRGARSGVLRSRTVRITGTLVALVACAALAVVAWRWPRPEIAVLVRTAAGPTAAGAWIVAPEGREESLAFSDGSTMALPPASALRLLETSPAGARVALECGTLRAEVRHRAKTAYSIQAGPYTVDVIGTRLEVEWEPGTGAFRVVVLEGRVLVRGQQAQLAPTEVRGGEELTSRRTASGWSTALSRSSLAQARASTPPLGSADTVSETSGTEDPTAQAPERSVESKDRGDERHVVAEWVRLADSGDARGALDAVRAVGLGRVLERATGAELLTLAAAAHRLGDFPTAIRALEQCRSRFPGSRSSSLAAFELARLARERGDRAQAGSWLHRYLDEAPTGPLAREVRGRLLEDALHGDRAEARARAREYVERFPDGPHAALARSVLDP